MELRHLRYYREVCRTLSFSRAAENLHIAQPPLSRQIQQLEEKLGVKLLHRTRPLALTAAGLYLYQQIDPLFRTLDDIVEHTRQVAGAITHTLTIGFAPSILYGQLPAIIRRLRTEDQIDVAMEEMVTVSQLDALKQHRIDLGFGRLVIDDPFIEQQIFCHEPLLAAVPDHHPLAGREISLQALSDYPLILYPAQPRPGYGDFILNLFHQRRLTVHIGHWANDMQMALGIVASGVGVALVPEVAAQIHRASIHYSGLADPHITSPIVISHRKGDQRDAINRCKRLLDRLTTGPQAQ